MSTDLPSYVKLSGYEANVVIELEYQLDFRQPEIFYTTKHIKHEVFGITNAGRYLLTFDHEWGAFEAEKLDSFNVEIMWPDATKELKFKMHTEMGNFWWPVGFSARTSGILRVNHVDVVA